MYSYACNPFAISGKLEEIDKVLDLIKPQKYIDEDSLGLIYKQLKNGSFVSDIGSLKGILFEEETIKGKVIIKFNLVNNKIKELYKSASNDRRERLWKYLLSLNKSFWYYRLYWNEKRKLITLPKKEDIKILYKAMGYSESNAVKMMLLNDDLYRGLELLCDNGNLNADEQLNVGDAAYVMFLQGNWCDNCNEEENTVTWMISNTAYKLLSTDKERTLEYIESHVTELLYYLVVGTINNWDEEVSFLFQTMYTALLYSLLSDYKVVELKLLDEFLMEVKFNKDLVQVKQMS